MSAAVQAVAAPKVVFPAPPPTSNVLTTRQRAQLVRTTKKLGRILGVAPRVLDAENVPFDSVQHRPAPTGHVPTFSIGKPATYRRSESPSSARTPQLDNASVPVLRLALATGPHPSQLQPASPRAHAFTLVPSGRPAGKGTAAARANMAGKENAAGGKTSGNALRRRKLDRLRHTLGDGVPQELIFPIGERSASSSMSTLSAGSSLAGGIPPRAAVRASPEGVDVGEDVDGPPPRPSTALGMRSVTDDVLRAMCSTPDLLGASWSDAGEDEPEMGPPTWLASDMPPSWTVAAELPPAWPAWGIPSASDVQSAPASHDRSGSPNASGPPPVWSASVDLPPAWSADYNTPPVYPTPGIPAIWCAPGFPQTSTRLDAIMESDDEEP
ncbi:hypothetical protein K523DRAFT_294761 [Schizophyllum commune Tattone D]|nr:hypothetical protein K523DRAFT_294761 [Schizophyllum commune Tattone D]